MTYIRNPYSDEYDPEPVDPPDPSEYMDLDEDEDEVPPSRTTAFTEGAGGSTFDAAAAAIRYRGAPSHWRRRSPGGPYG